MRWEAGPDAYDVSLARLPPGQLIAKLARQSAGVPLIIHSARIGHMPRFQESLSERVASKPGINGKGPGTRPDRPTPRCAARSWCTTVQAGAVSYSIDGPGRRRGRVVQ